MISAALPDPPPRCPSPTLLHHLRSSPPAAPRPEPRRPRIIHHSKGNSNGDHTPAAGASLASPAVVAAAVAAASRGVAKQEEEEESGAAVEGVEAAAKDPGHDGLPVPPPRHSRKRPARPPIPEEGGVAAARAEEETDAGKGNGVAAGVLHPWERSKRNGGGSAPLGRRSLRASRDSLCPTVCAPADPAEEACDDDDKADHWLLLPRRALAMDERQLRQDLAGLRFSMNLLDGQGAGSGNVWLSGVVPVDSGAPQPPARQHQTQGSPPATAPLKSPTTVTTPPGSRPTSHKGGNQTIHWFACIGGNSEKSSSEVSAHNLPAGSGRGLDGLEDSGVGDSNSDPFDSITLADSGKENAGALAGGLSPKDREERLRTLRDRQNEERQRKLEELKQQALAAQKFREQKEEERRRRIEQLRERDEGRRLQVEERKRQIWEAERDRREAILRKNQTVEKIVSSLSSKSACNRANILEREARIEAKRKNERSSIVFAFGSSTPRMLEPADTGGSFWGSRRATSTTNVMFSSMVGSTGSSGGGDKGSSGSGLVTSQGGVPATSSTSLSRRSSERELIGGVMSASMPAGSKKRAVSAHALDRKPGDDEGDGQSRTSTFSPYGPSPRARKKTDLMPTIPSPRGSGGDGLHQKARHKSPGRAFSMTRLDQLARPRVYNHPAETTSATSNDTHHHHLVARRASRELGGRHSLGGVADRSVSKSTSHLAGSGGASGQKQAPQERPLRRTDASRSMSHLGSSPSQGTMPPLVPRLTRAERLRRRAREVGAAAKAETGKVTPPGVARSGDATPSSPSRPLSALSVHSSAGSGVSLRHRPHLPLSPASHVTPLASPTSAPFTRKPRPVSIAITGVSHEPTMSPVGSRDIRSSSRTSSDNRSRTQSSAEKDAGTKPPKPPSAKKAAPKPAESVAQPKKSTPAATEKQQSAKVTTKTFPKASPIHSPAEPVQQQKAITEPEEEVKEKPGKEDEMVTSIDGMEKQDEMKPVEGEADEGYVDEEKEGKMEEKAELEEKEEKQVIEEKDMDKELDKGSQESSQDVDMTASMIARTRITTEEEAKAALAERRRLAREQAEREAELERLRLEEEQRLEEERQRKEEEEQRRAEAEQLRLLEEASRLEKERLQQAIEEAQKREREEAQRREEEARARAEKEEQDKKAREEAERQRQEMEERLKKEEEERQMRRKRVEAIMLRTRAKAATPTSTPTKGGEDKEDTPSEERKEISDQPQSSVMGEDEEQMMMLQGAGDGQRVTAGESSASSSEPTTTEGSPSNQGTSPGHPVSSRNDAENSVNSGTNLLIGDSDVNPLQAMLNNNGTEISKPKLQTNGHRNGMDFGPAFANVDDVRLNNTANNLLDLSEFDVHLQQTQQLPLSGSGSNAFSYSKQLSHEDNVNSNAHAPPSSMGAPHQPSIPSAPLQSVTGELDTIIPTGSTLQEDSLSSAKRQDKNATIVDLLS
ncbi:protein split ends isoform X6 [Hetaerina americana]|uniref:protein split ends isoform X6 n=1 Tax=Hetaerina americana TaxID=62018 RepID=UPI003A7F1B53